MSVRELRSFIRHAPRDSAIARSVIGPDVEWTLEAHLLASLVDAVRAGNWQRGGGKGQRPRPIPRPGSRGQRKYGKVVDRTPVEVAQMLAKMAGRSTGA